MITSFLSLAINPSFWLSMGLVAFISFAGGAVKGAAWVNASYWQKQAVAFQEAAQNSARQSAADARQAEADRTQNERLTAELEKIRNEANHAGACRLSESERSSLLTLAAGHRTGLTSMPAPGKRH